MPTEAQKEAFVTALQAVDSPEHRAAIMLATDVTKGQVSHWFGGRYIPSPDHVFLIEAACALTPGDLSRHLGYLPVGGSTVLAAISVDPTLTLRQRNALAAMFRVVASLDSSS